MCISRRNQIFVLVFCLLVGLLITATELPAASLQAEIPIDASSNRITLDVENLADLEKVTNQFSHLGLTFQGATVLGQGASLNFLQFPPHSGVNVLYDDPDHSGRIAVTFNPAIAVAVTRVGAYITGNRNVTMTAYDAEDNELGSTSTGGANHAPNGVPNKLLELNVTQAIHKVVFFNGGERGNTYTVDDFYFESGLACSIADVPLYKQDAPAEWADDLYGGSVTHPWVDPHGHNGTVGEWGCAMTSTAMIVSYYGNLQGEQTTTPRELNNWLRANGGYSGGLILWAKVAEFAREAKNIDLYYYEGRGPNNGIINAFLCNRAPMVLHTTSSPYSGHYVVATGVSSTTAWTVNDPGGHDLTSLDASPAKDYIKYGSQAETPEYLTIVIHPPNAPQRTADKASAAISILVTDPAGRVLEYDAIADTYNSQILDAHFGVETLAADDGSGTIIEAYTFATGAPIEGAYEVQIIPHVSGNYELDLLGYDTGGGSSSVSTDGFTQAGSTIELGVGYSPEPGSELDLVPPDWGKTGQLFLPIALQIPYTPPALPLLNGDFEQGATAWTEASFQGWRIIVNNDEVEDLPTHSGIWSAWLGGDDNEISLIEQAVTVPPDRPFLTYYHGIGSEDACGYDFGGVLVNGAVVDVYDLCADSSTGGWVRHVVNLTDYAGQTVALQIRVETDASLNSNLFVDDVAFSSSGAAVAGDAPVPFHWSLDDPPARPAARAATDGVRLLGPRR